MAGKEFQIKIPHDVDVYKRQILGKECPLTEDTLFNKRPEQLSVEEFIDLTNKVEIAPVSYTHLRKTVQILMRSSQFNFFAGKSLADHIDIQIRR